MTPGTNEAPTPAKGGGFDRLDYSKPDTPSETDSSGHGRQNPTDLETMVGALFAWSPGWTQIQTTKKAVGSFRPSSDPVLDVDGRPDLYLNACPQREAKGTGTGDRTADTDAGFLAALWVDLDRAGEPGHAADNQWTVDDVRELSDWLPVKPTVAVDSGGGWHLWFRLDAPLEFGTDGLAEMTLARWGRWWRETVAVRFDRQVDAVFNPGRIMRVPGTVNTKEGNHRPARIVKAYPERSVSLDDLDAFLPAPEPERRTTSPKVDDERPGDRYNREATQADMVALVESEGFHDAQRKAGRVDLTRPGKNRRDGHSVTVWADGTVTFWSSAPEGLPGAVELRDRNGSTGTYDPFGLYAALKHRGDVSDAARELAREYAPPPVRVVTTSANAEVPPVDLDVDPLGLMTVDELLARDMTNPEWLVSGIWPLDSYGAIGAMFKAGKTWLVLDLAVSVAAGGQWCGKWKTPPGPVIVFFGEGGLRKIRRRLEAIARSKGVDLHGLPIHLTPIAPNLTDPEVVARMLDAVKRIGPRLVIVDPLYLSAPGVKLQLIEVGALLQPLQVITDLHGAGLVVVHHWNQTGRGSGAERFSGGGLAEWGRVLVSVEATPLAQHEGHSETVLRVEVTGDEVAGGVGQFLRTVTVEGDVDDLTAPLTYSMLEQTVPSEVLTLAKPTTSGLVAAALRSGRVATAHEMSELFAVWGHKRTADTVYRAAEDLVKRGEIDVIEPDDVTGRKRYLMPGQDREVAA